MDFIHLHNHSDYSILDGAITIKKLISSAIEMSMPGVALTDHGNMFGAIEFYQEAKENGIKPIIGQEFYVAPESRFKKESSNHGRDSSYHLILLAKDETGYGNLIKLSSIGYTEGFYYKPRIDHEILEKHKDGLICSTACVKGEIPSLILKGKEKEAARTAGMLNELFGKDNFYLEIQDHNIPEQKKANTGVIQISKALGIPLIATNDCHYTIKEDAYSHDVLLCIQTGKTIKDTNRMKFSSDQFYLKSPDEMKMLFQDYPEALLNTRKILDMVDLKLSLGQVLLPHFAVPEGFTLDTYLSHLVYEGAKKRYPHGIQDIIKERIEYELSVITGMHFSGYFLIVWDFIEQARQMNIPVGPGRGSAAGSIVSYCLRITDLDPLKYNLLFERFLNPDRNEMPDIDIDFCAIRREEVIEYVKKKYGDDHVSQINTFNRLTAKAVLKDVARVMDVPFAEANQVTKLIPNFSNLSSALKDVPEFKKLYKENQEWKKHIDVSKTLEGLCRSVGKHAAGVVISRGKMSEHVPLYRDSKDGSISSQFEKGDLEKAGLVKMDFLGLKNLTIIDKCLKLIKKHSNEEIDIAELPLDDEKTYKLLQNANTNGIFQLESSGMQKILRELGPTKFEDIIAIVALYRPGPLESGMTKDFIVRKRNPKKIKYPHPLLEDVLKDTLGVIVYQEQVMQISQIMGGFSMPDADRLRKAMGKKITDIVDGMEDQFLKGAQEKKINMKIAREIYGAMKEFGKYGFNKSHSAAYAVVSYQTAYLKANYTIEYMTTLLSAQPDRQDDIIQYVNDCKSMEIEILPPDINYSEMDFTIEGNNIRFGLSAIKGVGEKAIETIIQARNVSGDFKTLADFLENTDLLTTNKGVLESLIKAGAFDSIHKSRSSLFASVNTLIETAKQMQIDKASGQGNLFDFSNGEQSKIQYPRIDIPEAIEWENRVMLAHEKDVLGVYISSHPLANYENELNAFSCVTISDFSEKKHAGEIAVIGIIGNLKIKTSRNGKRFAAGNIEDMGGIIEALFLPNIFSKYDNILSSDDPVIVKGKIEYEEDIPQKFIVNDIKTLIEFRKDSISAIHIKINPQEIDDNDLENLKSIIVKYRGDCPVCFHVNKEDGQENIINAHSSFNIIPSDMLINKLSNVVGSESIRYTTRS